MKKILILLTACLFIINLTGCSAIGNTLLSSEEPTKTPYPVEVGALKFEEAPKTVVSLSPAITEIISQLGFGDKLLGRSSYCNYPESVTSLPSMGSSAKPNIDAIIKLKPELLITHSPLAKKDIQSLENKGIRVLVLSSPSSLNDLYELYQNIASVFAGAIDAPKLATNSLVPVEKSVSVINKTDYSYVYIMTSQLQVATGDTFESDVLSYYGTNVAKDAKGFTFSKAEIASAKPYFIFLAKGVNKDTLPDEIKALEAYTKGRIITIDNTLFERTTSRISLTYDDINKQIAVISPESITLKNDDTSSTEESTKE